MTERAEERKGKVMAQDRTVTPTKWIDNRGKKCRVRQLSGETCDRKGKFTNWCRSFKVQEKKANKRIS